MAASAKTNPSPPAATDERRTLRWGVYALLIALSAASMTARLMQVRSASQADPSPFLSANDRSRWCTIRALGDQGTYAIDRVIFDAQGNRQRAWHTIDLVKHRGTDGKEHYYSSKPTLLPTLLAGEYWLIKQVSGASLSDKYKTFYIARTMLLLSQVLPLAGAFWLLALLIDQFGTSDWGRIFVVACATQATFLSNCAISLNNHVFAAVALVVAVTVIWPVVAVPRGTVSGDTGPGWWRLIVAGVASSFAVTCELPALAFFALLLAVLLWLQLRPTLLAFVPAAVVVFLAAVGTNYLAHGSLKPAYAHRYKDGPVIATIYPHLAAAFDSYRLPIEAFEALKAKGVELSPQTVIERRRAGERWVIWDVDGGDRLAVQLVNNERLEIRAWDDWYDYEGTYWTESRLQGVDKGEPSHLVYALHVFIGHHGIFSLTPIWGLSAWGVFLWLWKKDRDPQWWLAASIALLTLVVLAFYLSRPQIDRNYGGVTNGLRWLFWLIPLWLLAMIPAADTVAKWTWGRRIAVALFLLSAFSAHYAILNPWSHPWLFDYWTQLGWIDY